MRSLLVFVLALLLGIATPVCAEDEDAPHVDYPELVKKGADAATFVPQGWLLEKEITGDLNKDGADDLVLVLRDNDPANLIERETGMDEPLDTNPRMLAVALADGEGSYQLALANSNLIPRVIYSNQSDPLSESGGVSINRGILLISIYYFYTSGGSDTGNMSFRFRFEDKDFRLIGYDRMNVNRMSGAVETVSANFLNRKVIIKTGTIESDAEKTETRKLKSGEAVLIQDIEDPWAFSPAY